jgi:hypothetical protein
MTILYTGIGCNENGEHSEQEFLDIMHKEFMNKDWEVELRNIPRNLHYQLQFEPFNLPNDFKIFTIYDWIEYAGAELLLSE